MSILQTFIQLPVEDSCFLKLQLLYVMLGLAARVFGRARACFERRGTRAAPGEHGVQQDGSPERAAAEARRDRRVQPPAGQEGAAEAVRRGAQPSGLQEAAVREQEAAQGDQLMLRFSLCARAFPWAWCVERSHMAMVRYMSHEERRALVERAQDSWKDFTSHVHQLLQCF